MAGQEPPVSPSGGSLAGEEGKDHELFAQHSLAMVAKALLDESVQFHPRVTWGKENQ